MEPETLFSIANPLALLGWLALALFPRRRWANGLVCAVIMPLLFSLAYVVMLGTALAGDAEGGFDNLAEIEALFGNRSMLLAGWLHYLAFDLFIGAWQAREAQRLNLHYLVLLPCLALTFLVGPIGLVLFLAVRGGWRRRLILED